MKVVGFDATSVKVGTDVSDAPFKIKAVEVTSPNGGETLTSGNTHGITWTTYGVKGTVAKVRLSFTKNGGRTWEKIKPNPPGDTGTYNWTVPTINNEKTQCRVMIELKDASGNILGKDASDGYFTIQP